MFVSVFVPPSSALCLSPSPLHGPGSRCPVVLAVSCLLVLFRRITYVAHRTPHTTTSPDIMCTAFNRTDNKTHSTHACVCVFRHFVSLRLHVNVLVVFGLSRTLGWSRWCVIHMATMRYIRTATHCTVPWVWSLHIIIARANRCFTWCESQATYTQDVAVSRNMLAVCEPLRHLVLLV